MFFYKTHIPRKITSTRAHCISLGLVCNILLDKYWEVDLITHTASQHFGFNGWETTLKIIGSWFSKPQPNHIIKICSQIWSLLFYIGCPKKESHASLNACNFCLARRFNINCSVKNSSWTCFTHEYKIS